MKFMIGLGTLTRRSILIAAFVVASILLAFGLALLPPPIPGVLWLPITFAGLVAMIALEAKWTRARGPNPGAKPAKSDLYMGVLFAAIAVAAGFALFFYLWGQNSTIVGL